MAKDGDIPVQIPPVDDKGNLNITAGDQKLAVRTGGKNLRITVRSGKNRFSVPIDKNNWQLTIELDE